MIRCTFPCHYPTTTLTLCKAFVRDVSSALNETLEQTCLVSKRPSALIPCQLQHQGNTVLASWKSLQVEAAGAAVAVAPPDRVRTKLPSVLTSGLRLHPG